MKKILLLVLGISIGISAAFSQEACKMKKGRPGQRGEMKGKHRPNPQQLMHDLQFTPEQRSAAKAIHEEQKKKMDELSLQQNITVKEFNDKKTAIRKVQVEQFNKLLTKEQKEKMVAMKAERDSQHEASKNKKLEKLKTKIGLTDKQVAQIKELNQNTAAQVEKIKNNEQFNDQEKHMKIKAIVEKSKAARKDIFTPAQQKQMEALREKKGNHQRKEKNKK
jgi:Spy/CpxP family protein refolding chaperone